MLTFSSPLSRPNIGRVYYRQQKWYLADWLICVLEILLCATAICGSLSYHETAPAY